MGWGEKKRIMVVFHDIYQNYLHIQHQATKLLNINAKLVVVEVAPPHFRPTPKISRRFLKTSFSFAEKVLVNEKLSLQLMKVNREKEVN